MRFFYKLRSCFRPSVKEGERVGEMEGASIAAKVCGCSNGEDLPETASLTATPEGPTWESEDRVRMLPQYNKKSIKSKYRMGKVIGEGGFSVVRLVTNRGTGEEFACKIMEFPKAKASHDLECMSREAMFNEIELASRVNCKQIAGAREFFLTKSKVYIIETLMQGGVLCDDLIQRPGQKYTEEQAKCIFKQLLEGLAYLHSKNVVHRDLKLQNLMLVKPGDLSHIKIVDFGLSKQTMTLTNTVCGSPLFVAPEILSRAKSGHGLPADMWSAGVILYALMGGYSPFYAEQEIHLFENIENCKYNFGDPAWSKVSQSAKDLIGRCLVLDPEKRATACEALNHPWFLETTQGAMEDVIA